jgi:environmental stress-induced protein Ves
MSGSVIRQYPAAGHRAMPWANGRGVTREILREEDRHGRLLLRLSLAQVVEDGPFSALPGIARWLTVIAGPGFDLLGPGLRLRADPLRPLAFSGDLPLAAKGVTAPSEDFNVMRDQALPPAEVSVLRGPQGLAAGGRLFLLALGPLQVAGRALGPCDLLEGRGALPLSGEGPAMLVRLAP